MRETISGLLFFHPSHKKTDAVSTITLDTFCNSKSIHNFEFLKIDVWGYKKFVLDGLDFTKRQPEFSVAKFEDSKTQQLGYTVYNLADFLVQQGYSLLISEWHPIIEHGKKHSWYCLKIYTCPINSVGWGNIIAFKPMPSIMHVRNALEKSVNVPLQLKEKYLKCLRFRKKQNGISTAGKG